MTTEAAAPLAKKEAAAAPIRMESGLVQLQTYEEAYRFARSVVQSQLAPISLNTPEKVLVAMQHGAEVGLKPMQSLQSIAVINGRPSIYGRALAAIVMRSGLLEVFDEWIEGTGDNMVAMCRVKRVGVTNERVGKFSVEQARKAGLWGKAGTWSQYPQDMLKHKARARAFEMFADVLAGLPVAEDVQDVPAERLQHAKAQDPLLTSMGVRQVEGEIIDSGAVTSPPTGTEAREPVAAVPSGGEGQNPTPPPAPDNRRLDQQLALQEHAANTEKLGKPELLDRCALSWNLLDEGQRAYVLNACQLESFGGAKELGVLKLRAFLSECVEAAKD